MFKETLRNVVDNVEGGLGALLMGFDGIAVDHYSRDGYDVETLGMEFSVVLNDARKATVHLDAGPTDEISFRAEKVTAIVRILNDEYFLALALSPQGNSGKGRFLLRLAAPKVMQDL